MVRKTITFKKGFENKNFLVKSDDIYQHERANATTAIGICCE